MPPRKKGRKPHRLHFCQVNDSPKCSSVHSKYHDCQTPCAPPHVVLEVAEGVDVVPPSGRGGADLRITVFEVW